jgi:hypothetical protein
MSDSDGSPCIHLQSTDSPGLVGDGRQCCVHHIALACSGPDLWRHKLRSMNIEFAEKEFAVAELLQFNLRDPNGVRLELLFETQ